MVKTMVNVMRRRAGTLTAGGALLQAALLLGVLVPLTGLLAAALAHSGGAENPYHAGMLTWLVAAGGAATILYGLEHGGYPHASLGLCNTMTILRAAGIAILAGLLATPQALDPVTGLGWTLVLLAAITLSLDGVDGWAARRSGLRSAFGARFDMESDVAFALVMAALAWQGDKVGAWFLALGLIRPAFLLAGAVLPALRQPLPEAFWRKTIAAVQMGVQVVLLAPILPGGVTQVLAAGLLAMVASGFAVDIRWLLVCARQQS